MGNSVSIEFLTVQLGHTLACKISTGDSILSLNTVHWSVLQPTFPQSACLTAKGEQGGPACSQASSHFRIACIASPAAAVASSCLCCILCLNGFISTQYWHVSYLSSLFPASSIVRAHRFQPTQFGFRRTSEDTGADMLKSSTAVPSESTPARPKYSP